MIIPLGRQVTAWKSGAAFKYVDCEKCGQRYVYLLARKGTGNGFSVLWLDNNGATQRAFDQAEQNLNRLLQKGVDPAPCPHCGRIQTHMFKWSRPFYNRWMKRAAYALLLLSPLLFIANAFLRKKGLPPHSAGLVAAIVFCCGGAMLAYRAVRAMIWDPNTAPRMVKFFYDKARSLGLWTGAEFDEFLATRRRQDFGILQEPTSARPQGPYLWRDQNGGAGQQKAPNAATRNY